MSKNKRKNSQRTHTITWGDQTIDTKAFQTLSGLDFLRARKNNEIPDMPIVNFIGFKIKKVEFGNIVFIFEPAAHHYNYYGTVHGGVLSTILDSAMASAVRSTLPVGYTHTMVEFKVNFTHPVTIEAGEILCEGNVIHSGRRIATAEGKMTDNQGKLYAHSVSTCMIFEPTQ